MEETELRAVVKYLMKKNMSPSEIHADFVNTLGDASPSYEFEK